VHLFVVIILYIVAVFGGGALISPLLYHAAQWAAAHWPALAGLAQNPFHRFVHRSLLVLALLGLFPLIRMLKVRRWDQVGFSKPFNWKLIGRGFIWGFFSLAAVVLIMVISGSRALRAGITVNQCLEALIKAGFAAVLVAPIEELLFRGAVFGTLRKGFSWQIALGVSSVIFGIVHFFGKPLPPPEIHWYTGFWVLGQMISGFGHWNVLLPGFLNLCLVGIMLGWVYQHTRSLYFSVGLHAGWIFWLKVSGFLTQPVEDIPLWFWGTHKLTDGWLCFILLTATWFLLLWKPPQVGGVDKTAL